LKVATANGGGNGRGAGVDRRSKCNNVFLLEIMDYLRRMKAARLLANSKCPKRFGHRRLKFRGKTRRIVRGAVLFSTEMKVF